jgi:hypothetical protein
MKTVPERDERLKRVATEWVHFCRVYQRPPMANSQWDIIRHDEESSLNTRFVVRMTVLAIPCWILMTVLNVFDIPFLLPTVCYGVLFVGVYLNRTARRVRFEMRQAAEGVPEHPPKGSRLHCIGIPSELPMLVEMPSVFFESQVYRARFTTPVVALCLVIAVPFAAASNVADQLGHTVVQAACACAAVAVLLPPFFQPVYYRVSPARLEVLYYGFLRRKPIHIEEYDLRQAHIVADFRRNRITIGQRRKPGMNYLLWFMPDRKEFVHRLFLAAISKYRSPELPRDTL